MWGKVGYSVAKVAVHYQSPLNHPVVNQLYQKNGTASKAFAGNATPFVSQ